MKKRIKSKQLTKDLSNRELKKFWIRQANISRKEAEEMTAAAQALETREIKAQEQIKVLENEVLQLMSENKAKDVDLSFAAYQAARLEKDKRELEKQLIEISDKFAALAAEQNEQAARTLLQLQVINAKLDSSLDLKKKSKKLFRVGV